MRALVQREGLLSGCQLASAAISSKDVKPILKNFKAIAANGRCTLMATDLEVGIRLDVRGLDIQEEGEAILPATKLIAILREAREEWLSLEADPSACVVRGTKSPLEFEMPSEDPAQFPDFPSFEEERYHEISAGTLREMVRRTVFAAADDSVRFSMAGVMFELDGDVARLVATDGRRLALAEGTATGFGGHTTRGQMPVVPSKAMNLLERNLADDPEEPVRICLRPNEVLFRTETATIYSRLVEGRFPDYKQVMPKKPTTKLNVPVAPFQAAVRQAAIMTDADTKRVAFQFSKGKLTLQSQGATAGRSRVELPLDFDGKPIDINFNPDYLIEMLKVLPPDGDLVLKLIDGANPALLEYEGTYSYLVMPLT